jgi:hypothetical protein
MRIAALVLALAALLAGCAHPWYSMNLPPGTPRDEIIAKAGAPIRVVPLPNGGQRLQYTLMPMGHYAFMVDLDANGRLVQTRQVMTPREFHRIEVGRWTVAQVEAEFGPPARIDGVASWPGRIYTYRWYEQAQGPMFWFVYFDAQGVVGRSHPAIEHLNGGADRGN